MHIHSLIPWPQTLFRPVEKVRPVKRSTEAEKPDRLYGPPLIAPVTYDDTPNEAPGHDLDITI